MMIKGIKTMPYYKTTISIDVLTEEPIPDHYTLEDIGYEIEQGDWVGYNIQSKQVELTHTIQTG